MGVAESYAKINRERKAKRLDFVRRKWRHLTPQGAFNRLTELADRRRDGSWTRELTRSEKVAELYAHLMLNEKDVVGDIPSLRGRLWSPLHWYDAQDDGMQLLRRWKSGRE